ncbi:MAG: MCE family protein [Candidatus Hydrogenedens sp.]|nr:MCE family protein [Candidatus Hydrogenedens sp.]
MLACMVLLGLSIWLVSGYYDDRGNRYGMEFKDSILGLYEGAIVEYLGVPVGKVRSIRVLPNTSRPYVEITTDPDVVTLYVGVKAQLVMYSFAAGTMAISLTGGDPAAGPLQDGSQIETVPSTIAAISTQVLDMMDELTGIVESVKVGLEGMEEGALADTVDKVNLLLDDGREFLSKTQGTVDEVTDTIKTTREKLEPAIDKVLKMTDDLEPVIQHLDELLVVSKDKIAEFDATSTSDNLDRVLANIAELSEKLNKSAEGLDNVTADALHQAGNIEYSLRRALTDMSDALSTMRVFVEQVSQDPASLLRGKPETEE